MGEIRTRRTTQVGGIIKQSPGKDIEEVRACDEKRGVLRRKEGDVY